jgi:hypothetical protein
MSQPGENHGGIFDSWHEKRNIRADLRKQRDYPELDAQGRPKYLVIYPGQKKSERMIYHHLSEEEANERRKFHVQRNIDEGLSLAKGTLVSAHKARSLAIADGTYTGARPAYLGHPAGYQGIGRKILGY